MNPLASPRWQIAVATCACAAASAYVYAVDPGRGGYPTCLLYQATGFFCAGCGATRACHALLHGRLLEALHDNALFMLLLPVTVLMVALHAGRAWRTNHWPVVHFSEAGLLRGGWGFLILLAAFMTLRNLPGAPFDLLRPLAGA